jgi:hypothetical protein
MAPLRVLGRGDQAFAGGNEVVMRIKRSDKERLFVVHFPLFLAVVAMLPAMVTILMAYGVATDMFNPPPEGQSAWAGVVFSVFFSLVWGAVFSIFVRKSAFNFDLVNRELSWTRRSIYGTKAGIIPFSQIKGALVEIFSSGNSSSTYRPALSTDQGTFPLMTYYTRDKSEYERIATAINAALKANPVSAMEDEILELLSQGDSRRLLVIQMVRERYGYDLLQARQFVDTLTERLSRE